jgi:pyruvate dehydrogenase E2 component (dihydrolipoamide acetyltransferase)
MNAMANLRPFAMPKWGIEMTEGVVAEWMVSEGQPFKKGDILALIETDKITNEVEAEADGKFERLIAKAGGTYQVGELIAVLTGPDERASEAEVEALIAAFKPGTGGSAKTPPPPTTSTPAPLTIAAEVNISPAACAFAQANGVDISGVTGTGAGGRITFQDVHQASLKPASASIGGGAPVDITPVGNALGEVFASPLAKRLAVQHGVDLSGLTGTGPKGRIRKADVLAMTGGQVPAAVVPTFERPASGSAEIVKMSPMRKAIAKALSHSKSTIPHFYLRSRVRIDAILGLRAQAKAATGETPSINDYIVRACAIALTRHPDVNATDKGLITPIVRGADGLSVTAISRASKALANKARAGKLRPEDYQGGSFSISNLGMFGIDQFDAIINPPQGAILAVGAASRQPTEIGHALAFATIIELSLSCDHRAIDGAVGADFMRTLKALLEEPALLTA